MAAVAAVRIPKDWSVGVLVISGVHWRRLGRKTSLSAVWENAG